MYEVLDVEGMEEAVYCLSGVRLTADLLPNLSGGAIQLLKKKSEGVLQLYALIARERRSDEARRRQEEEEERERMKVREEQLRQQQAAQQVRRNKA